jgi:predicted regulator of Ras-like GTPase activity (Roadblock/LC7/MglB family)
MPPVERRRLRSELVQEALSYQLAHIQDRESLRAFVLVDRDGLLVAAAPTPLDVEALSALCPLLLRGEASPRDIEAALGGEGELATALLPLSVRGEELYLLSIARGGESAQRAVRGAASGVERILGL